MKRVGWCYFLFLTILCSAIIMVYGLYFDVTFSAEEDPKSEYMVSQCPNGMDISEQARINHSV